MVDYPITVECDFDNFKKEIKQLISPLGLKYKDLDICIYHNDANYRSVNLNETRIVEKYLYLPLLLNKFAWLKKVKIKEQKQILSFKGFDSGWTYRTYLEEPVIQWVKREIL